MPPERLEWESAVSAVPCRAPGQNAGLPDAPRARAYLATEQRETAYLPDNLKGAQSALTEQYRAVDEVAEEVIGAWLDANPVAVTANQIARGINWTPDSRSIYRITTVLHESTFACNICKSPARPSHFVCFQRFSPGSASRLLGSYFLAISTLWCTFTRADFRAVSCNDLHRTFLPLIFTPRHTTSLKIIRGVGSNAGIFSQVADQARVLDSR